MKYIYLLLAIAFNVVSYLLYKSIAHKPGGILWTAIFGIGLALGAINVFFLQRLLRTFN